MKTITIKQPWADLICSGVKDIENRTWPTHYRGKVLIHASAKPNISIQQFKGLTLRQRWNTFDEIGELNYNKLLPCSAIIGSVEIVDCVVNHESIWAEKTPTAKMYEQWPKLIYNWILANPILFPEPIPAKGKLSFWDYPNILAEPEEKDGPLFCHCQLTVHERIQVSGDARFGYYCRYCGGKWYK